LYDEWRFDAIYERLSLFGTGALEAARVLGVPHLLEIDAPLADEAERFRRLARAAEARTEETKVVLGADALLPVSFELASWAVGLGADRARVHVLPNAVDPDLFAPGERTVRRAGRRVAA